MARHYADAPRAPRITRAITLVVVWILGLVVGLFCLLGFAVRFAPSCKPSSVGLACHAGGSVVAVLLLLAVVAAVTTATVMSFRRDTRTVLALGGGAVVVLLLVFVGTRLLLASA